MNGIHDELVELKSLCDLQQESKKNTTPLTNGGTDELGSDHENNREANTTGDVESEESWEQVGKKNKSSTLRKVSYGAS